MKSELKKSFITAALTNQQISFLKGDNVLVNATEMAKPFSKSPSKWLEQVQTKEFLTALQTIRQTDSLITTYVGRNGGTWFHEDVALEFARWKFLNYLY